jgi:trehalose 6-phosphate phosphatase
LTTSAQAVSATADLAAAIDRLIAARPPLLVIADFDGTLAPGSRDPGAAAIDPVAQRALRHLARIGGEHPGRVHVVVLTGRTVRDVASRVRVGGIEYLGDHGLQHGVLPRGGRASALDVRVEPGFEVHGDPAERLALGVADELGRPSWLFVERKGPSVAFHVRQAEDVASARAAVIAAIGVVERREGLVGHGLEHYRGRSVVDLRPRDAGGKREAVERLIARLGPGAILVLGDELSDVDAFEAVIAARAGTERAGTERAGTERAGTASDALVGVNVAVHGARPAPPELSAVADLHVGSARAVARLLASLARRLATSG